MEKFTTLTTNYLPLPIKDVDTDMIIPAQYLTSVSREGFGKNLFRRLRDEDPKFPLNNSLYQGAQCIIADSNFGCGSSREHAVWAISGAGFKVVIAKSFADIFAGNAVKNGLLLISLPADEIDDLLQRGLEGKTAPLRIDLENQTVTTDTGKTLSFQFDPFRKRCLLAGQDDFDYLLSHRENIEAYWERRT